MKKVLLILVLLLLVACSESKSNTIDGFCGSSSMAECSQDSDCVKSGCSGQVCESSKTEGMVTTCEWLDCYASEGHKCGCVDNKCQWD